MPKQDPGYYHNQRLKEARMILAIKPKIGVAALAVRMRIRYEVARQLMNQIKREKL
jgi:hypothetical protein